jgi:hypothetical protein
MTDSIKARLDEAGWDANMAALDEYTGPHTRLLPFWQNTGASTQSKNVVRSLLADHAGTEPAELIRWYLNELRNMNTMIDQQDVETFIRTLRALKNSH